MKFLSLLLAFFAVALAKKSSKKQGDLEKVTSKGEKVKKIYNVGL